MQFTRLEMNFPEVTWIREKQNLGLARHMFLRITETLEVYENVIVIEDDVSVTMNSILSLVNLMNSEFQKSYATAGLFGAIPHFGSRMVTSNKWRRTKYFSAWGWSISREIWKLYSLDMVKRIGLGALEKSEFWHEFSENQKSRWIFRFNRVAHNPFYTWDYQMQFLSFVENLQHLLPVYRMCDNVGFNDFRATNTKSPRPWWYRGNQASPGSIISGRTSSRGESLLERLDSYTWIGDRKLTDNLIHFGEHFKHK